MREVFRLFVHFGRGASRPIMHVRSVEGSMIQGRSDL